MSSKPENSDGKVVKLVTQTRGYVPKVNRYLNIELDWLRDQKEGLSTEAKSILLDLLPKLWRGGGCIPDNDLVNSRACSMDVETFRAHKDEFLIGRYIADGLIYDEEIRERVNYARKVSATKSANRKGKTKQSDGGQQ